MDLLTTNFSFSAFESFEALMSDTIFMKCCVKIELGVVGTLQPEALTSATF